MFVTEIPEQTGLLDAEIRIPTGIFALTTSVIRFEVAGFPVAQVASEFKMQIT